MTEEIEDEHKEYLHHHTDEIVCPYCYHSFQDSWDYGNLDKQTELDCTECGKEFSVFGEQEYYFYTDRIKK